MLVGVENATISWKCKPEVFINTLQSLHTLFRTGPLLRMDPIETEKTPVKGFHCVVLVMAKMEPT